MSLLSTLNGFSRSRLSWQLLLGFVIFFILCALTFQHILHLAPCVMCIYERIAMFGIGAAAIVGIISPDFFLLRWIALIGWGGSAYKGLMLALEHVNIQTNIFATCEPLRFPDWAPLNHWFPWMFEATGDCSEIVWQFLTLSMPQWLVVIFAGNLIAFAIIVLAQFAGKK